MIKKIKLIYLILKTMLSKDDAKKITDAKISAYIKEQALEIIPVCINNINDAINKMEHKTSVHIEGVQFIPEIIVELEKVLNKLGYQTTTIGGRGTSWFLHIYWRELTDQEKERLP